MPILPLKDQAQGQMRLVVCQVVLQGGLAWHQPLLQRQPGRRYLYCLQQLLSPLWYEMACLLLIQ